MRSEISIAARVESLAAARAFIERACAEARADAEAACALKLAVDEACANIIEHGYAGRPGGSIAISCEDVDGALRVTIVDGGRAFSPEALPPPDTTSSWRERPIGGLGWHFLRSSVDVVDYAPDPAGGNRLTLVKRLRPPRA